MPNPDTALHLTIEQEVAQMRRAGRARSRRRIYAHLAFMVPALLVWIVALPFLDVFLSLLPAAAVAALIRRLVAKHID